MRFITAITHHSLHNIVYLPPVNSKFIKTNKK